jgi:hypothetical protein
MVRAVAEEEQHDARMTPPLLLLLDHCESLDAPLGGASGSSYLAGSMSLRARVIPAAPAARPTPALCLSHNGVCVAFIGSGVLPAWLRVDGRWSTGSPSRRSRSCA